MKAVLESLARLPGVKLVMLVAHDGVPIAVPGKRFSGEAPEDGGHVPIDTTMGREDAVAAVAAGWLGDLTHAVAPLSWKEPTRVVLRAARGTLVMRRTKSAVLLVILAPGLNPEELRLSMDGSIARIERSLHGMGRQGGGAHSDRPGGQGERKDPPGPIPSTPGPLRMEEGLAQATDKENRLDPSGK